jgi:hypothetical protein
MTLFVAKNKLNTIFKMPSYVLHYLTGNYVEQVNINDSHQLKAK